MRKFFIAFFVVFALLSSVAIAQEGAKLKSVTVSWGDSAFTSGLNTSLFFNLSGSRDMELVGNSDRFYATLNNKFGETGKLSVDLTGGVFKKIPWVGPRVVLTPIKQTMFMYWGGWGAGRIGALKPEVKSFCQQFSLYVYPTDNISLGYTVVKVDAYRTTQLPEVAYSYKLRKDMRLGASATYDVAEKKPLFCMFLTYTFPKK